MRRSVVSLVGFDRQENEAGKGVCMFVVYQFCRWEVCEEREVSGKKGGREQV